MESMFILDYIQSMCVNTHTGVHTVFHLLFAVVELVGYTKQQFNPLWIFYNVRCIHINGVGVRLLFRAGSFVIRRLCRNINQTITTAAG